MMIDYIALCVMGLVLLVSSVALTTALVDTLFDWIFKK